MINVGQVCVKLAGREARQVCAVVDTDKGPFVVVSGPRVKRRKCNIKHLEPLAQKLSIKKGASDEDVKAALEKAGLVEKVKIRTEKREKKTQERRQRKQHNKEKPVPSEKKAKKAAKATKKAEKAEAKAEKVEAKAEKVEAKAEVKAEKSAAKAEKTEKKEEAKE